MITEFKLFEKKDIELLDSVYFLIPYNDKRLIEKVLEKYKDILKLNTNRINKNMKELSAGEYDDMIGLYVFIKKDEYMGYWTFTENPKNKIELQNFVDENNMTYRGLLELEPYEIEAIKYNL